MHCSACGSAAASFLSEDDLVQVHASRANELLRP